MNAPLITFLTDYGLEDHFVGVCHGVIARICPEARVIDITHGIARHDVQAGALVLETSVTYTPVGVHLAVVDPEVGGQRRGVAIAAADGRRFVGPDNGVLIAAAERCGGVVEAVEISGSPFRLEPVSATFHGRDVFAPVAAHLAAGVALDEAGVPYDPDALVRLELPQARTEAGVLVAHAVYVDRFGNVGLNVTHEELGQAGLKLGHVVRLERDGFSHLAQYARTFADVAAGELLVYEDAEHRLAVALSSGDAATELGLATGDELRVTPV